MNLLIVNDEAIAVQGMVRTIPWEDIGISEVRVAYDAAQAKDIIESWSVDIALCDIEMPGESGIELIEWASRNGYVFDSIILTCHADFDFARQALRLGVYDYILTPVAYEKVSQKIQELVDFINEKRKNQKLQYYGNLWVSDKVAQNAREEKPDQKKLVKDIKTYINDNLGNPELSVNGIAAQHYMNADYLNRVFKKNEGISLKNFIINERMNLASVILEKYRYSCQEVAQMVGYENYSPFVTAFRNRFNCSPTEYMEMKRRGNN